MQHKTEEGPAFDQYDEGDKKAGDSLTAITDDVYLPQVLYQLPSKDGEDWVIPLAQEHAAVEAQHCAFWGELRPCRDLPRGTRTGPDIRTMTSGSEIQRHKVRSETAFPSDADSVSL